MNPIIAMVGLGGVFPGAPDLDAFWALIHDHRSSIRTIPQGRWLVDPQRFLAPGLGTLDRTCSLSAGVIEDFVLDPSGLALDPEMVERLDPLFHLLLEAGRQAVHDARLEDIPRERIGVILGQIILPTEKATALTLNLLGRALGPNSPPGFGPGPGARPDPLSRMAAGLPAGILAEAFGLKGCRYTLDAACASSLFALKLARDELMSGRADAMICGGLSRPDSLYTQMGFAQLRALSPSGRPRPYDRSADGLVVGEGCGLIVLKRLDDALRQGDHVYGLVSGIGLSNDTHGNLLAPQKEGQLRAMNAAYASAGWRPWDVDLIEGHGTGTPVGDQVEIQSLAELWSEAPGRDRAVLGSVKSNIGHLLTGAGAAGLIKILLAMRHQRLPATAHFSSPRPELEQSRHFEVLAQTRDWPESPRGGPRQAALSAFGFGGTNAHVLIEELLPGKAGKTKNSAAPFSPQKTPAAIVGLGGVLGPWPDATQAGPRLLGGDPSTRPSLDRNWWGWPQTRAFQESGRKLEDWAGFFLPSVTLTAGRFRIPPKEIEQMLPQQILMLVAAAEALDQAGFRSEHGLKTGVFIGLGLDPATTGYHLRWSMDPWARDWAKNQADGPQGPALEEWIEKLKQAIGPPLTADRVLGSLGSITASRIARQFHIGGPSHTVSNEEASGLRALDLAIKALSSGDVDLALAGGVDLAGDIRILAGDAATGVPSRTRGDGAAAVAVKRLEDAERDKDRIFAVITGRGEAGSGLGYSIVPQAPDFSPLVEAARQALIQAGTSPEEVELIEIQDPLLLESEYLADLKDLAGEKRTEPPVFSSAGRDVGFTGGMGLASIVKAALSLHTRIIPDGPRYWLTNRSQGPRQALVIGSGSGGEALAMLMRENESGHATVSDRPAPEPLRSMGEGLFVIQGDDPTELLAQLHNVEKATQKFQHRLAPALAEAWHRKNSGISKRLALALIARSASELNALLPQARHLVSEGIEETRSERVFHTPNPLGEAGRTAFCFPGSGNFFKGMGRDLSAAWPGIFRRLEKENQYLKDQFLPEAFWDETQAGAPDPWSVIIGQVSVSAATADLVRRFGLQPQAAIGYSLGESAAMIGLRAWQDRDEMLRRMKASPLFRTDLAGPCHAARKVWNLSPEEPVDWISGIVECPPGEVRKALTGVDRAYLLIVNTPDECVIGGQKLAVHKTVERLGARFLPLSGVSTVHCHLVEPVAEAYLNLHRFATTPPPGVDFYSAASGRTYVPDRESVAAALLAQVSRTIDFPKLIEQAYADGIRFFLEMGPGGSLSRMIGGILQGRPHLARSAMPPGQNGILSLLQFLAVLTVHRQKLDLSGLFPEPSPSPDRPLGPKVTVKTDGPAFKLPSPPPAVPQDRDTLSRPQTTEPSAPGPALQHTVAAKTEAMGPSKSSSPGSLLSRIARAQEVTRQAHGRFLKLSERLVQAAGDRIAFQMNLTGDIARSGAPFPDSGAHPAVAPPQDPSPVPPASPRPFLDRDLCLEFARGQIGRVLGPEFKDVDRFPTRVRLPDEPLMLVDRIMTVEGRAKSMTSGRVVTQHDVRPQSWYLDGNRIPTGVAIEAGQADLFLCAWLGIDFITEGLAMYRLLDAEVVFHQGLPEPGALIEYDIKIDHFFRHGDTWLFRFHFDGTVDGKPLLSMRNGCAGFFSPQELASGRGIVKTDLTVTRDRRSLPPDWISLIPVRAQTLDQERIARLTAGDLAGCFGPDFQNLNLTDPLTLPSGRLAMIDRVTDLDPQGGWCGLGRIVTEVDIRPDDWFLTCHFVDDQVMPGTLMYECSLQSLRVFMMRLGMVDEKGMVAWEPVPGINGGLKCRGQVIASTKTAAFEVSIKELGFRPEPYAVADGLMYADGRAIVEIKNMSLKLTGSSRERLMDIWGRSTVKPVSEAKKPPLFGPDHILAFATGRPSDAFGPAYQPFDRDRFVARLPGPPFCFLDRIIDAPPRALEMKAGSSAETQTDLPPEAWYFLDNHGEMPLAVLLEIALQSCGWLAAYMGSALTSDHDLHFRNLGGAAVQLAVVGPDTGPLTTRVTATRISRSGGMIIQNYDFEVTSSGGPVYKGDTYFGFFSAEALAQQKGLGKEQLVAPSPENLGSPLDYPKQAPYPSGRILMMDRISLAPNRGPQGLGQALGIKKVRPDEWFFKAHFLNDPVWPGSLGLEAMIQVLKVMAAERFGLPESSNFQAPVLNVTHSWTYRGQVIPSNHEVNVEAATTSIDPQSQTLIADGILSVDGLAIYEMKDFSVQVKGCI